MNAKKATAGDKGSQKGAGEASRGKVAQKERRKGPLEPVDERLPRGQKRKRSEYRKEKKKSGPSSCPVKSQGREKKKKKGVATQRGGPALLPSPKGKRREGKTLTKKKGHR